MRISVFPPVASTRFGRRLLRLGVVFVLVAAITVAGLPWLARQAIGPDRLKAWVAGALTDALGRQVSIQGDVSIIVVPWFGLSIGPLRVADAPGFGPEPMLSAAHAEVTIRVLPLLAKVVSPGAIRVRGLTLNLRRDAAGRSNWADLTVRPESATQAPAGWQVAPQPGDIRLTDATVAYEDQATGRTWRATDARLATGLGQPFNFSLSFRMRGPADAGDLQCLAHGRASLDPASGALAVNRAQTVLNWTFPRPLVPGGAAPLVLAGTASLAYDPATRTVSLTELDARLPGARLSGTARVLDPAGTPRAEAALTLRADPDGVWRDVLGLTPSASANLSASDGHRAEPAVEPTVVRNERFESARSPRPGQVVLTMEASLDAGSLSLREARLALPDGGSALARGTLVLGEAPKVDVALAAEDLNLAELPRPVGASAWVWPVDFLSRLNLDARLELRHCRLGDLSLTDFHATAQGRDGHVRLSPVSAVLPAGLATVDARLDAVRDGLTLDARGRIDPLPASGLPRPAPTLLRLTGRIAGDGAKGTLALRSPELGAAGKVLGLAGLPPAALDCRGTFAAPAGAWPRRVELTGLEGTLAGVGLRGRLTFDAAAATPLTFDFSTDSLDADKLAALPVGGETGLKAEGKLQVERLALGSLDVQHLVTGVSLSGSHLEAAIAGADLFGGKLSGKVESDPTGRLAGSLHLAGAEAGRLPGGKALSGQFTAKAALETAVKGGHLRLTQATVNLEAQRLSLGQGTQRQILDNPTATLTAVGREATNDDGLPVDATLSVRCPGLGALRDVRLSAQGPLVLDKAGRLREAGTAKLEASAVWPDALAGGKALKLSLTGPLALDLAGGGFNAGELRFACGGLAGTAKVWRKAGESGPTAFSLDTGQESPRQVLADWGITPPRGLAADRLSRGRLALSGTAGENGLDVARLHLSLDDSNLNGKATFPHYDFKHGKWDLNLDRLDWDAYFPPGPPSTSAERKKPLDLHLLRELSLDGRLAVGWLKKDNVTFDASTFTLAAHAGVFTLRQESPRFYGGLFFAEVRGDARDAGLRAAVELKMEGFEAGRFLRDWVDGDTLDSGSATFILATRTSGASEDALRANLSGNARLQITRGFLKVHDATQAASQTAAPQAPIPFEVFSSSWQVREGVGHTEDFFIDSPRMQVRGKGQVNLRDETMNLSVLAALADGGQAPATIVGPLDGPKLTIDRNKMFGDMLYRLLQGIVSIPGKTVTHILRLPQGMLEK